MTEVTAVSANTVKAHARAVRLPAAKKNKSRGLKVARRALSPWLLDRDRYVHNDLTRRSGAIVFSSSTGEQLSWERDDLANGVFTEFILRALGGAADKNSDQRISMEELRAYVATGVTELTTSQFPSAQTPTIDRDNTLMPLGFPIF